MMYREQQQREATRESFAGDYAGFLKGCDIRLSIESLAAGNLDRVYELAQRTNQMNFSGNRYPREELEAFMSSATHATYVMRCVDRFGSYGIVGFALVDVEARCLLDLMFSCRIQAKRVEHAFLGFLLRQYMAAGAPEFSAVYRKTEKNRASGKVFEDMGFVPGEDREGMTTQVFSPGREIPDENIVHVTCAEETEPPNVADGGSP
jgi:FkbH-like protein